MKHHAHFLFMTMAISLLTLLSCGETASDSVQTNAADNTTETAAVGTEEDFRLSDSVETVDFGGKAFNILARTNFVYEFDAEQTGDVLEDAVYNRNRTVEERFNIDIVTHAWGEGNGANILEFADPTILAGDDAYQLLAAYTHNSAPGSFNGYYVNWYDMPHIDLNAPYWESDFLDEIALDGNAYVIFGDLSLQFNEVTMAIFFNKKLAGDLDIPDLYSTVRDGKWTLELLTEYAASAKADLNGDGKMDDSDRFGIGANLYTHTLPFLYGCDLRLTARDDDGYPTKINTDERIFDVYDKLMELFNTSGAGRLGDTVTAFKEGMFEADQGLFMTSWIGYAGELRNMKADFGIIPYPKWDEAQENYAASYLDRATSFLVPITADADFVGRITEVMACESYNQVIPAFYDTALDSKYVRDNESQEMLDIITENIIYDFSLIFSYLTYPDAPTVVFANGLAAKQENLSSQLARTEKRFAAEVTDLLESANQPS